MEILVKGDMGGVHRSLLCQGPVEITSYNKRKKRYLSLFNDVLVVSSNLKKKFKIKCIIPLNNLWAVDDVILYRGNKNCSSKTLFLLRPTENFFATFRSKEQKDQWYYFLKRAIDKAKKGIKKPFSLQILTENIPTCDSVCEHKFKTDISSRETGSFTLKNTNCGFVLANGKLQDYSEMSLMQIMIDNNVDVLGDDDSTICNDIQKISDGIMMSLNTAGRTDQLQKDFDSLRVPGARKAKVKVSLFVPLPEAVFSASFPEDAMLTTDSDDDGDEFPAFSFLITRCGTRAYYEEIIVNYIGQLKKAVTLYGPQSHYVKELLNGTRGLEGIV
uniref:uncharacterized protein LOC117696759 n=1 Tax=Arvicanthis niloticus TaxID=61156 RepID=UPI0014867B8D|nr:uncharacterized protein LOC117696759 [Arvicanthis niloticus]